MTTPQKYLTTPDVATRYGVAKTTVRHWVKKGWLVPAQTTTGGHHRYTEESLKSMEEAAAERRANRTSA